jgi:uncharacterized protein YegL
MRAKCIPIYIVVDTSRSMVPFENVINVAIETLYDDLITSPRISEFAYISIMSYNNDAEVVLRITDLHTLEALPEFKCGGVSNFAKAVILLHQLIDDDVAILKRAGRDVLRPLMFLLIGSSPTNAQGNLSDNWRRDYASLVDKSYRHHPHVVPFGYRDTISDTLREIATIPGAAFLAKQDDISDALRKVIPTLLNSIVNSARDNTLRFPANVEGYIQVSPDFIHIPHEVVDSSFVSESTLGPRVDEFPTNSPANPTRDQVFISYSHTDRKWLQALQTHLRPYLRRAMIAVWDDTQIRAGTVWRESVENALASAKVAVLLVSPDFLASGFIAECEFPPLLEAARNEGVTILWVPVRFSSFDITPIGAYQAAHSPERPLASLSSAERDKALVKICEVIQRAYRH